MNRKLSSLVAAGSLVLLAACAEGSTDFGTGAAGTGAGTPQGGQVGHGGEGEAGTMTSAMGGEGGVANPNSSSTSTTTTTTTSAGPMCGDSDCGGGETCSSCPADCLPCCPNGSCDNGETTGTCPQDCPSTCPNGNCEATEDAQSCPDDCATGDCDHSPCSTGGALSPDCDPCAFVVCTQILECCILGWDGDCVAEAESQFICGC